MALYVAKSLNASMRAVALVWSALVLAVLHNEVSGQCGFWTQSSYDVNESGGSVTLTAAFDAATIQQLQYATRDGTATENEDYVGNSGTLVFTADGDTLQDVVVIIINDDILEQAESFFVDLSLPGGTVCSTATIAILDDDLSPVTQPDNVQEEGMCPTPQQRELAQQVVTASFNDFTVITNTQPIVDHPCGPGFWTKIALLNLTNPSQPCPSTWTETITAAGRGCTRPESPIGTCLSATYSTLGVQYTQVCGRIIGIQNTSTDAFLNIFNNTIDGPYVDGVSLTHGMPRQHIWSFASGLQESAESGSNGCFCGDSAITPGAPPPAFVGNNYFCESGNSETPQLNVVYTEDPLWDGLDCPTNNCCEFNSPPWFNAQLPAPTSDDIEVRLCCDQDTMDENIIVQLLELYVSSQTSGVSSQTTGALP